MDSRCSRFLGAMGIALSFSFLTSSCAARTSRSTAPNGTPDSSPTPSEDPTTASPDDDVDRLVSRARLERRAFVRAVLARNPSIAAARQGWRAAQARIRESGVLDDPMVKLEVAPLSVGSSSARLGYTASLSQRLPWPGKLSFEDSLARAEAGAAKNDFETMRRDLALAACLLYDRYFVSFRSLEINAQHVALLQNLKAGATAGFESGRGSAQDPLQAEAELTHLEHDSVVLATERDVTIAEMNALLHRDPRAPLPPPPKDLALEPAPDVRDSARLASAVATKRTEIEAARLRARAEQARAERAGRESYPDFTLSTSYNSMWDMPEHRWMVGVEFNLPIQTGRRAGAAEAANAERRRFEYQAVELTDKARAEVAVGVTRLEEAGHVVRLFETRLVPVARDQVDAARAGFVSSRNSFTAVVDAERNLRGVELEQQVARADFNRRVAELERAIGIIPGLGGKEAAR